MIDANELRKGCLILNDGLPVKVLYIMDHYVTVITKQGNNINCQLELVKPIPLTPEILEACGFDENKFLSVGDQTIQIVKNEFCLAGIDSSTSGQCFIGKIEYLHQLQNLYYSLTGKELTYTPLTEKA